MTDATTAKDNAASYATDAQDAVDDIQEILDNINSNDGGSNDQIAETLTQWAEDYDLKDFHNGALRGCEANAKFEETSDTIKVVFGHDCGSRRLKLKLRWRRGLWNAVRGNAVLSDNMTFGDNQRASNFKWTARNKPNNLEQVEIYMPKGDDVRSAV